MKYLFLCEFGIQGLFEIYRQRREDNAADNSTGEST